MLQQESTERIHQIAFSQTAIWLSWIFFPFTIVALFFDSTYLSAFFAEGIVVTTFLTIVFFVVLWFSSNNYFRKLLFIMVFLSYLGEIICCKWLQLYEYRQSNIPLYVPLGHAIVYASGVILSKNTIFLPIHSFLKKASPLFFLVIFLSAIFFLNDVLTLIFGVLFFLLMKRKKHHLVYYFIAVNVVFIELVGTFFECWTWEKITFGCIPTANPPLGAVVIYAVGDVLLPKIAHIWEKIVSKK